MTSLRILTYNIHSCRGTDGQYLPERIAHVISTCRADVVALQEVDVNRARSSHLNQAHRIAHFLRMEYHFHPSFQVAEEYYGNAILSYLPLHLVKAGSLPGPSHREPRGTLWVTLEWQGRQWQILNTHLGLTPGERHQQVRALLSPQWLGHPQCHDPVVLCGDLNTFPRSGLCRRLCNRLADAVSRARHRHMRPTFPSRFPLVRLDHIFVSPGIDVLRTAVHDSPLARAASDHLPLVVELAGYPPGKGG